MRVLVVAMVDSVHTARWLAPLQGAGWDVHLFPSTPPQLPHPLSCGVTLHGYGRRPKSLAPGLTWRSLSLAQGKLGRVAQWLAPEPPKHVTLLRLIERLQPDLVHSMETQSAGYLTAAAKAEAHRFPPWLHSSWGSDIFLFDRLAAHRENVRRVLAACDAFHTDCQRDVALARDAGFRGRIAAVIAGQGGLDLERVAALRSTAPPAQRTEIVVKGHQGWAGRGLVALRALDLVAPSLRGFRISVVSAPPEVQIAAELLAQRHGLRIDLVPPGTPHDEMLRLHGRARVSLGLAISDGVVNAMLEAMAMGSFPIQSDTGCGCDWIHHGETGFLVHPEDPEAVAAALRVALHDDAIVDRAAESNAETVRQRLDQRVVGPEILALYRAVASSAPARTSVPTRAARPRHRWPWPLAHESAGLLLFWMPKAGCSTLTEWFLEAAGRAEALARQPGTGREQKAHGYRDGAWFVEQGFNGSRWSRARRLDALYGRADLTRVVVVRNPLLRLVSSYFATLGDPVVQREMRASGLSLGVDPGAVTFRRFVELLEAVDLDECDAHVRRQLTNDCWHRSVGVDHVVRLERLTPDFDALCERLGLPPVRRALGVRPKRPREDAAHPSADVPYRELMAALRAGRGLPANEQFYDDVLVQRASALYADDLRVLGYQGPRDH
ncbi:MAG: glycosyltransferase [Vicinamibacteria bacterium]|nr:glycosyltransferase [Vicinamibacteria bacterium]